MAAAANFPLIPPRRWRICARATPKLGALIDRAGPFTLRLDPAPSPFESLLESILYQQLHGKAAATIHRRVREYFGGDPAPQFFSILPTSRSRAAGVSGNKIKALRDLAARTLDGTVPTHAAIKKMTDAEIVERLTQVRGIGPWTVEMLLIFRMGRPDVLPVTDYGVRKGFALTFQRFRRRARWRPQICPSPRYCSREARVGRRSVRWPVGTCGGPATWLRAHRLRDDPAYNRMD